MNVCINHKQIEEGDLIALLDGEAEPWLHHHVERCAACASKLAQLRHSSKALLGLMYRASCPPPELLGQYHLDLLSASEQLTMAAHVRKCLHCSQELSELAAEEPDSLIMMVWNVFQDAVQVLEGVLMPSPRRGMVGVRGRKRQSQNYIAEGVNVLLNFQPVGRRRREGMLIGTIQSSPTAGGGQAWLFCEGEVPISTKVDSLGTFIFDPIRPGNYDLALGVFDTAILLREVNVGD